MGVRIDGPDAAGVAVVTIDRATRMNTLSAETIEGLDVAFRSIESARAVVLTGAGGESFAAGANIGELADLTSQEAVSFAALGQSVLLRIEESPAPVIAAIDGYCLGGGLDLALACDIRHASARSQFAHPGAKLGILTGFGGTARLTRLVGRARALELFATARRIDANEALAIGLIDRVDPDPLESAKALALNIAEKWQPGVEHTKLSALKWWRSGP